MGLGEQMQKALFILAHFEEQLETTSKGGLGKVAHSIGVDPEAISPGVDKGDGKTRFIKFCPRTELNKNPCGVPGVASTEILDYGERNCPNKNLEKMIHGTVSNKKRLARRKGRKRVAESSPGLRSEYR